VPAPAVIPALKVYINTVVVKTPVVYQRVMVVDLASPIHRGRSRIAIGWLDKD
jgi:hypothetical protein